MDQEIAKYHDIIAFIREEKVFELDPTDRSILKKANKLLKQIDNSEIYRESRLKKNRRIFPEFVSVNNLRLFRKWYGLDKKQKKSTKGFWQQNYLSEIQSFILMQKKQLEDSLN